MVRLGAIDNKEYYMDVAGKIHYRVPDIREAVRAESGWSIVSADYSQVEVRIMAYLSGDPWLREALNSGKDVHCYMASDVHRIEYDLMYKAYKDKDHARHKEMTGLRNGIKTTTFGIPYGAGVNKVAQMTELTIDEAQDLLDKYFDKAKALRKWLDNQASFAIKYGYSASPRGRKRFYTLPAPDDEEADEMLSKIRRWAGNQPIQSGSADMLKLALKKIYLALRGGVYNGNKLYDARILFVVHDEIVMTAREEHKDAVAKILKDCMEEAYDEIVQGVINSVDVGSGPFWSK